MRDPDPVLTLNPTRVIAYTPQVSALAKRLWDHLLSQSHPNPPIPARPNPTATQMSVLPVSIYMPRPVMMTNDSPCTIDGMMQWLGTLVIPKGLVATDDVGYRK